MKKIKVFGLMLLLTFNLFAKSEGDFVDFVWSGGVTDTKATVVAKIKDNNSEVICVVSPNKDLSKPNYISPTLKTDKNNIVRFDKISKLNSNTQYYYAIKVNGKLEKKLFAVVTIMHIYYGVFQ